MPWRSILALLLVATVYRQATSQDDCRSTDRVQLFSILPPLCETLRTLCLGNQIKEALVGSDTSFTCSLIGDITFIRENASASASASGQLETLSDGGRFSISGQTLMITNVHSEDEAEYRCSNSVTSGVEVGCLTVSGLARFRTCDDFNYNFVYTSAPARDNSCSQDLNVTEGDDVVFDTRLMFGVGGDCQCIEEVTLLRVRTDYPNDIERIVYSCDELRNDCNSMKRFEVRRTSNTPYDFSLVLPSVNMNDSRTYFIEIEVKQPGVVSVRRFWKIFQLTVNPGPPTTTMVTEETTMQPPTTPPTTDTSTSTSPSSNTEGQADPNSPVIGGVVGGVLCVLLLLLASLIIGSLLIYKCHRTASKDFAGEDNQVVVFTKTVVEKDSPGLNNRESMYIRTSVLLSSQHESRDQLNI